MVPNHFLELCYASLTVIITVLLVLGLKAYGNIPTDNIGPDLNLLTYGFLWDTVFQAIRSGNYWPQFPEDLKDYKIVLLMFIVIANTILMAVNFKLAYRTQVTYSFTDKQRLRFLTFFLGIVSLVIFLVLRVYLN